MTMLNIKLANRTERVVFQTLWAANLRARDLMASRPEIRAIEVVHQGVLQATYQRRG